jgi:hypothetical protein
MNEEKSRANEAPYFFPTSILALLPGLFAWQVHGFWIGLLVWCIVAVLIIAMGWLFLLRQWTFRWLTPARSALIITSMMLISASGAEHCHIDGGCQSIFFGRRAF